MSSFSPFPLPVAPSPYAAVACSPHFGDCLLSECCPADFPVSWCFSPTTRPWAVMKLWLALDPMLNSPTDRRVATSTLSREAKVCFGHRLQMMPCRLSLAFWVLLRRHLLNQLRIRQSFVDSQQLLCYLLLFTGVLVLPLWVIGGSPRAEARW